jgi:hypothetical protein
MRRRARFVTGVDSGRTRDAAIAAARKHPVGGRAKDRRPEPHRLRAVPVSGPDLPPPCTIYVGGFISPTHGESPSQQIASTLTFESEIGRPLALDMHYYQFTDAFPGIAEQNDLYYHRLSFDSWHCGDTDANIAASVDDALIGKRAEAVAAYGGPVFLRYKWEMNLTYNKKRADPAHDVVESDGRVH